jgi:hypothetical protein
MNTIVHEPKQGATIADLLTQKPQEEVSESKPSTVSSYEEKLAAGISTIGLQAKRLSGAQRKRLLKERKMKDGTWTVKKPKRNTPPSQEKGTVGSSGGIKRPHSDSSTPSHEKQQPKKPRNTQVQTGTYKEAVIRIKMAIIHRHYRDVNLDQAQTDMIQARLLTAVDANRLEEAPPQFLYSKFAHVVFWFTCANELTKKWLTRTISGLENFGKARS